MGADKLNLPFGDERMLQRVVRLVGQAVDRSRIVVVAAAGQTLPELPTEVRVVRDARSDRGPLEGLAAGLAATANEVDAAYATGCDVPLLAPEFVERMFDRLGDREIAVPRDEEFFHPLAAVYRPRVLPAIDRLLAADRLRPFFLFQEVDTESVSVEELRAVDPELTTLRNLNRREDYLAALASCGFAPPEGFGD